MDTGKTVSSRQGSIIAKPVRNWLLIGVVMVFFQVVIGGVTRLTDSGLSITEWAVIQGTLPPLNEAEWQLAFEKYKLAAKKQYESLHADMMLPEFKVIYYWEYAHRLWARLMGFVFLLPFLWFLAKKQMPKWLLKRLGMVILLASLAAVFGWVMVASGLNDDSRTWVSAYKLVVHLGIATALFAYLFWTWQLACPPQGPGTDLLRFRKLAWAIVALVFVQIVFGGLMAGMRAALIHPHFPVFVDGARFWAALSGTAGAGEVIDYEPSLFVKAVVQLLHRGTAWILAALILWFLVKVRAAAISNNLKNSVNLMVGMLCVQFLLGVFTVINSVGKIPLLLGAVHQAGALLLLAAVLKVVFQLQKSHANTHVGNYVEIKR